MRRTKIIATIGPATQSPEMLQKLIEAGMDIARINMSHAPHDWVRQLVKDLRQATDRLNRRVAILMDTQGPAIRTGDLPAALDLQPGQRFVLTVRGETSEEVHSVDVNYEDFVNDISVGDVVLVDNGAIEMKVLAKHANHIDCEVLTPGKLGSRRHINLPGVKVSLPSITAKDKADIALGLELKVDFIALSFVREAQDIRQLRAMIRESESRPRIVAKIEDQQAVKNIAEIIEVTDAIMVARGDLGIECPYEELPIIQRRVVKACLQQGRPVIVATHMLESMIQSPMPTRAEITDVANAVFEQSDAIMLSGETTVGQYPVKCVQVFDRIARRIERSGGANYQEQAQLEDAREKLVHSAVQLANQLKAAGILVMTRHGVMARHASWMRPRHSPIFAICQSWEVAQSLVVNWGITPLVVPFDNLRPERTLYSAFESLLGQDLLKAGDNVVVIGAIPSEDQLIDSVQIRTIE